MAKKITSQEIIENDVFGNLRKSAEETQAKVILLETSLKAIKESANAIKSAIPKSTPVDSKSISDLNALQAKANATAQAKLSIDKELIKEKVKLSQVTRSMNEQVKDEIALEQKSTQTYTAKSAALNALRRQYKDLAVQNKTNTKEAKALLREITALDHELKSVDATVGQHQRSVGNYGNALGTLKGRLMQLTAGFGVFQVLKSSLTTVMDFETQVADLSAVTGQTGKDLDFLKQKAIDFSKKYGESAASIAEAFKLAGSARPELLANGAAMADLTEKAIILSKASGDDVPTSIKNLTGTLNAFELPASSAGKVMDTLANAAQLGSQEIPYLTEAFTKFGAIAKSQNISVAESAAAVELLGQKMPDAATAGTGLRNVMLKLMAPDALGKDAQEKLKALGVNFDDLKDKSKPFSERLELLKPLIKDGAGLVKVFGSENAVAAQILLSQTDQLEKFTAGLDKNGTAQEQAATKSQTLAEAGKRLKSTFDAFILNMANGVGASKGLTNALDFLANNFDTILSVLGKFIIGLGIYKTTLMALKMIDRIKEQIEFNKALKDGSKSAGEATDGVKGFGQALKSAGIAAAIGLIIELGTALFRGATGANQMAEALARLEKTKQAATDFASERVVNRQNKLNDAIQKQQDLLNEGRITQKQFNDEKERLIAATKKESQDDIKLVYEKIKATKKVIIEQQKLINIAGGREGVVVRQAMGAEAVGLASKSQKEILALIDAQDQQQANLAALMAKLKEYNKGLTDNTIAEIDNKNASIGSSEAKKKEKEAREKHEKYVRKETHAIEEQAAARDLMDPEDVRQLLLLDEERARLAAEIAVIEAEITLEKAKQSGNQNAINEAELRLITAKKTLIDKQLAYDLASGNGNVNEEDKLKKQAELDKLQLDQKATNAETQFKLDKEWIDLATDYFIKRADERIKKIDEEMKAAEKQADFYRELAANGNITAQQSLAEQDRIIAESNMRKQAEERRKQNILMVSSILQAYNSNLSAGDNSTKAFTKAITSTELLKQFVTALPTFYEGTETTIADSLGSPQLSGKDGYIVRVDGQEKVLNPSLSKLTGDATTSEIVAGYLNHSRNIGNNQSVMGWEMAGLENRLDKIEQAILNKPETNIELGNIYKTAFEIMETKRTPTITTRKTFKVRP